MARKKWEKSITKVERPDDWGVQVISSSDVRMLLARHHRAMVRMVKKIKTEAVELCNQETDTHLIDCWHSRITGLNDILAALAKQGARKKKD